MMPQLFIGGIDQRIRQSAILSFTNPYLLERPDLIDPAVELIGFADQVFGPLL
jgi:hypothetical protein